MTRSSTILSLLVLLITLFPCIASAQEDDTAAKVVSFFESLAQISERTKNNCASMGSELNAYLDANKDVLRDAAYSTDEASSEQETAILAAATTLGTNTGACYNTESVTQFLSAFTTLSAEIGDAP